MRRVFIWLCPVVATLLTCFYGHAMQKRLVPIPGSYVVVSHDYLVGDLADNPAQRKAIYPRIKKLYGGRYIMTYQSGRLGPRIFCSTSDDLVHWSRPKLMLAPEKVEVEGVMDLQLGALLIEAARRQAPMLFYRHHTVRQEQLHFGHRIG